MQPVDHYQLNERAAKYALLFIGLTFISFFMFELLKGLRVHPIQYALVGMGLAIFYLVLLALTEHLGFALAYLIAALASVALNGFYLSHVLGGPKQGMGFAALLGWSTPSCSGCCRPRRQPCCSAPCCCSPPWRWSWG